MQGQLLLDRYKQHGWMHAWLAQLRTATGKRLHLKGVVGSLDAVLAATTYQCLPITQLFILHDQEEAAYFYSDLQCLLGSHAATVRWYPASPLRPHTAVAAAVEADQLMRSEVLMRLYDPACPASLIVTYPGALTEGVMSAAGFAKHTRVLQVGEKLPTLTFTTWLLAQGFEKVDTVYEAGQFATRGGIIDLFSYASQFPFRLSRWGDEITSLRTFDPETQRSLEEHARVTVVSRHDQTAQEARGGSSFLEALPAGTPVWMKDEELVRDTLGGDHAKAWQRVVAVPFGKRCYGDAHAIFTYEASPQPSFNQHMPLVVDHLHENAAQQIETTLVAASARQLTQLQERIKAEDATAPFQTLLLGLRQGFLDHQLGLAYYTDHQILDRYYRYRSPKRYARSRAITLRELKTLQLGDYVVHVDYGIGRFAGLTKTDAGGQQQEGIRLLYKDDDVVCVGLQALHKISKYAGKEGTPPAMTKLGSSAWAQKKKKVKDKLKDIAKDLIQLYGARKQSPGFSFSPDNGLHAALAASFMYEETPDQAKAIAAVTQDMEALSPMDRLLCGDVGFGKTEVAIRAAFKAVHDGKQVAVLVPTTILALQHYHAFCRRLARFGIALAYINRFRSTQEIRTALDATEAGNVQILIGTRRILSRQVKFKDLGLLIIDEEQKFGVQAKDRLKQWRVHIDVLTLTATPIPRTLHFSLMGARDLSIINTPPPNRQPIATSMHTFHEEVIRDAIAYELQRGGQVFFVHNRVVDIEAMAHMVYKLVPEARVGVAHGQMAGLQLEKRMLDFIEGAYDVLVTTSIIESGLDIPNVNTMIINHSHLFGLSDLHQMRGRVGRSNKKAFCYLLTPPPSQLTADARRRLGAIEELSELGDGFQVAMRDLDIRGAGNLLGAEQSGFVDEVGFETYCQILEEAVKELKEGAFKSLFTTSLKEKVDVSSSSMCALETDLEAFLPETYVSSATERMQLYTRLDRLRDDVMLHAFEEELVDRFGTLPAPVQTLLQLVQLRWLAQACGLCKLSIKRGAMRCYLSSATSPPQSKFITRMLAYAQKYPHMCRLQEVKAQLLLIVDAITEVKQANVVLKKLQAPS